MKTKGEPDTKPLHKVSHPGHHPCSEVNSVNHEVDSSSDTVGSILPLTSVDIYNVSVTRNKPLYCEMVMKDHTVIHQIDPGATAFVLPTKHLPEGHHIRSADIQLKLWDGTLIPAFGKCKGKS